MAGMSLTTGLISGMDTGTLISQLMQVEANPQTLLKTQLSTTESKTTAYQSLNTKFDALKSAALALQESTTWTASKAQASATSVTATAGAAATPGSVTFDVNAVAATHSVISAQSWTATGSQTPADLPFGSTSLSITVGGVTTALALDRNNDGTATLAEAVAAINATSSLGLSATTVQTSPGVYRLQVTANKSGATAANFQVGAAGDYPVVTQGADAQLTVGTGPGKYVVTSSTNTFSGLLNDTTITVGSVATGVTLSVASDPAAVTAKVKSFVDAANAALASITAYTSASSKAAVLKGDSTLRSLSSQILDVVSSAVGGTSAAVAGLQLNKSGSIDFKPDTFTAKLGTDPALVKKIFAGVPALNPNGIVGDADDVPAVKGMAEQLSALAAVATDKTTGTLTLMTSASQASAKDLQTRIDAWDIRLALRKESLTRQFTSMEKALGTLQNQSSWLSSQIGSLPSWSASSKS